MSAELRRITPGLHVLHSRLLQYNSGIFASNGEACLIDPGIFDSGESASFRAHVSLSGVLRAVIITHSHWDHVLGPGLYPGVTVIQQTEALAVAHEHGAAIERQVADWRRQGGITPDQFHLPEPDETFADTMRVAVGEEVLDLIHAPGHAEEQLVVYHAESGLLWAADMLSDMEIPFVMQSLAAYRRTLDRLAGFDIRALVPGHGSATTDAGEIRARLDGDRAYLAELQRRVSEALEQGRSLQETISDCADMQYRRRDDNDGPHRLNAISAFYELGGRPVPGVSGWNRLQ